MNYPPYPMAVPLLRKEPTSDIDDERTEIRFEPFWEYHLAKWLKYDALLSKPAEEAWLTMQAWFHSTQSKDIKEGVFEFLLLLLDQDKTDKSLYIINNMWRLGIDSQVSLSASMWFAGPKLSLENQNNLAALAQKVVRDTEPRNYINAHDLFAFMYFICESSPEVLDVPTRLNCLQKKYSAINETSLVSYYLYLVKRHFATLREKNTILDCLTSFSGCEVMSIAPELAELTIKVLARSVNNNMIDLLEAILKYLSADYNEGMGSSQNHSDTNRTNDGFRYFYRQWVLFEFCRVFVQDKRISAYDLLAKRHWYKSSKLQIGYPTKREMRQEANLAFGYWYRHRASDEEQKSYVGLIKRLASSRDLEERRTAYFLIRHTESTERRKGIRINKVFHPILRDLFLYQEPKWQDFIKYHYEDFKVNLRDIDQIVQQQRRNTYKWNYDRSKKQDRMRRYNSTNR